MKKISQSIDKNYKMPRLYLDDLIKIEEIIKEATPKEYKITIGSYEYESVDEIPKDLEPIHEFTLRTYDPYISLDFGKYSARIYISNDDLVSSGIFNKINKILTKSERKILWLPVSGFLASTVLGGIEGQLMIKALPVEFNLTKIIFLFLSIIFGLYMIVSYITFFTSYSTIEILKKNEKVSFLKRNKDQLILISFGAIIGSLVTVIIEKFLVKK